MTSCFTPRDLSRELADIGRANFHATDSASNAKVVSLVFAFVGLSLIILINVHRGRVSPADLAELNPRLLGPDVLGERMVVPPSIPDWVFMDCKNEAAAPEVGASENTLINRVRQSICSRS